MLASQVVEFLKSQNLKLLSPLFSSERTCVLEVCDLSNQVSVLKIHKGLSPSLSRESSVLESLDHPNIVKSKHLFQTPHFTVLHLSRLPGQCLIEAVLQRGPLDEQVVKIIGRQLVDCLLYLNTQKNLAHMDLKPDNLIFDFETQTLGLIDFEQVVEANSTRKHRELIGTGPYRSPEVNNRSYDGLEAQNWSLGVTLFVLLTGTFPFLADEPRRNTIEKLKRMMRRTVSKVCGGRVLGSKTTSSEPVCFGVKVSVEGKDFVEKLLSADGKDRKLEELVNHPWLTNLKTDELELEK